MNSATKAQSQPGASGIQKGDIQSSTRAHSAVGAIEPRQQSARGCPAAGAQTGGRMDELTEEEAQTIGELMDHLIEWVEDMADDGFTHGEAYSAITLFASAISQAQREVMN